MSSVSSFLIKANFILKLLKGDRGNEEVEFWFSESVLERKLLDYCNYPQSKNLKPAKLETNFLYNFLI